MASADLHHLNEKLKESSDASLPQMSVVRNVQPETETLKAEISGDPGTRLVSIRHPYMSANSWIRCMPEVGTSMATQVVGNSKQVETWGYISHRLGEFVKKARKSDTFIYRQLRPGELEMMSSGRAYAHWSEDGDLTLNGGIVEQHLSQTELEHAGRAPTFKRHLDQHDPTVLAHEERFGLVKRPDTAKPYSFQKYMKDADAFQYEYGRWLRDDAGKDLISLHEGHLWDQTQQIKNGQTNRAVRLRRTIQHRQTGTLTFDVDEELNLIMTNTSKAKTTDLDFVRLNEIKISAKKLDFSVLATSSQSFTQSLTISTPKFRVSSFDVGFGAAPTLPAVLGPPLVTLVTSLVGPLLSVLGTLAAEGPSAHTIGLPATAITAASALSSIQGLIANAGNILSSEVKLTK